MYSNYSIVYDIKDKNSCLSFDPPSFVKFKVLSVQVGRHLQILELCFCCFLSENSGFLTTVQENIVKLTADTKLSY